MNKPDPTRRTTALLVLAAVILVDGSYLLVLAFDEGARLTFGSNLLVLVVSPIPALVSGAISLGLTRGSASAAKAGVMTAGMVAIVSFVFAAMKVGAIGTYGDAMDGAMAVVEIGITSIFAAVTLLVGVVVTARRPKQPRD
jgi:hypothetical protein